MTRKTVQAEGLEVIKGTATDSKPKVKASAYLGGAVGEAQGQVAVVAVIRAVKAALKTRCC